MLPSFDAGDGRRIAGDDRHAQVGSKRLGHRSHDRPSRSLLLHERDVRCAGDGAGVVVFDQQKIGMRSQDAANGKGSGASQRSAGRILGARRDDQRPHRSLQCALERVGQQAFVVDRNRNSLQAEVREEIEDAGKARVLDRHPIASPQRFA